MIRCLLAVLLIFLTVPAVAGTIKIATVGPMTGSSASIGAQMAKGAELAVKKINEQGGLLGQKVELLILDDGCDPRQATTVANQLANKGVAFVAGHFCSSASIPAASVYSEQGIIMMTPASTNPLFTDRGLPYVFRYCGRDDKQGPVAAGYIAKHYKNKKIALVHDKSAYGKGLADAVQGALRKAGLQEVFYEAITAGERDFTPLITRLKRDKVGVLFIGGYYVEAALIKRQAADQGLDLVLVAGDSLVTSEYWGITKDAGVNTFMTFAPDPRNISAASDTVKDFRAIGYEPEGYTLVNYAVIETWAAAVRSAGSVSADKVQVALKKESFDTILGSATFDAKGDNIGAQFIVYRWANGAYSPVNDAD